jgi:hypothetical protein
VVEANRPGGWDTSSGAPTVVTLEGDPTGVAASGTVHLCSPRGLLLLHDVAVGRVEWQLRIPAG